MRTINLTILIFILLTSSCVQEKNETRMRIDLQGEWLFELDPDEIGVQQNFFQKKFADVITLPGTTDTNNKGTSNTNKEVTSRLSRLFYYVGKAWYKKEVFIPKEWEYKNISLVLERTKPTRIWVDGKEAGKNDNISTAQVYDLSQFLIPGNHEIAIMVDNGESVPLQVLRSSHAYSESTQTNWNGIIGDIYLEATNYLHIEDIQLYPDAHTKSVKVKVKISSPDRITKPTYISLSANAWNTNKTHKVKAKDYELDKSLSEYEFDYFLGNEALLWSEFHPVLYKLDVQIKGHDKQSVNFGLRDFAVEGTQFTINGDLTFLRGKLDCCVFPLTAHTAMDLDTWRHYFQTGKSYGINHWRFHSWCPPKACFEAADIEGMYLQPELPIWGSLRKENDDLISFLQKEGNNIQHEYGNHASFVMFALGNELSGDFDVMKSLVESFRQIDSRYLYSYGSSNYLGFMGLMPGGDYMVTCRIGREEPHSLITHTRSSFAFSDAYDGGYINHTYPNTVMDFTPAISDCYIPVIGHETGQFQIYPNYKEIAKYTGVLYPYNMEVFRQRLDEAGMLDQAEDFLTASGKWAAELYKADIEMNLRTPGFAGFQLLDLQDFPGQGTALVGILDAFMDSKGLIDPSRWKEFCCEVVPLFITEKFCWTSNESLNGKIKIANYSPNSLENKEIHWKLKDLQGYEIDKGSMVISTKQTGLLEVGQINSRLSFVTQAQRLNLDILISGTTYRNSYPIWVYPDKNDEVAYDEIAVTNVLSQDVITKLINGGKVLWFPKLEQYKDLTVGGLFMTDYWNYRMFKNSSERSNKPVSPGTLGILTNPAHPFFNNFPTDGYTNWQWFSIIKQSYPLILDRLPKGYKPIVQVIDNIERNHKLGLVFEFAVEKGKLLICMSDLESVQDKPEVRQFYNNMMQYMMSDDFTPVAHLSVKSISDLFNTKITSRTIEVMTDFASEANINQRNE